MSDRAEGSKRATWTGDLGVLVAAFQRAASTFIVMAEARAMGSLTTQQRRAVEAVGEVLVMAGAGAGKTSTLVARVLDRVLEGAGRVSLDRVLVVTFNEAAAAEMRHRLQRALEDRLKASPDDAWLEEQAALLETAMVSTLHGFCLRLIREHFHELSLDPQFAVQDPMQTRILRGQVLGEVLRTCHAGVGPEAALLRTFLGRHGQDGDGSIQALVLRIHEYARSLPEGMGWLRRHNTAPGGARVTSTANSVSVCQAPAMASGKTRSTSVPKPAGIVISLQPRGGADLLIQGRGSMGPREKRARAMASALRRWLSSRPKSAAIGAASAAEREAFCWGPIR